MNDRAWLETTPDGAVGLRIGMAATAGRPRQKRRVLLLLAGALGACAGITRACWRGDLPLWMAGVVLAGICSAVNPVWGFIEGVAPARPSATFELAILSGWAATLWVVLLWSVVVFWRSLVASRAGGGSMLVAVAMLAAMSQVGFNAFSSARQMSCYSRSLWREASQPDRPNSRAIFEYDEASRMLWIRGPLEMGAAEGFRKALEAHPATLTIGLTSPGGYVAEGRQIAAEILGRRLDTYAPERCASACIDLFAAGQRRWAGENTVFGFHRSGHECQPDNEMNKSDLVSANFLRERGVDDDFVRRASETPYSRIWKPDIRTVLGSGLVTGLR
jgi:hypothetical protein